MEGPVEKPCLTVLIGREKDVWALLSKKIGLDITSKEYVGKKEILRLFLHLFPNVYLIEAELKTTALNPVPYFYALFETVEDAAHFKLKYL